MAYDQDLLDLCFSDMDHLLTKRRPVQDGNPRHCVACGGHSVCYAPSGSAHPGSVVCNGCGIVQPGLVYWETMYGNDNTYKFSNYKRIHHWHERISQLLLTESQIPAEQMFSIASKLCDGTYNVISKDTIREVLRSLNMQLYIEKWLQIIYRITKVAPPIPCLLYTSDAADE